MAQLSTEERIRRIELAPEEIRDRVAKAFLREDIDDEDIQYLFNTDTFEELNDANEDAAIENINAEPIEGIGAGEFSIRNSKPSKNKNFITTGSGGWNTCIKGYPTDPNADALANCVGHASGRFNEIINEARGTTGCAYKNLNCNAENFIERAKAAGLETGSTPRVGAIGCAMKGSTLSGKDGAGHVWIVERVYDDNSTYTSESGYGSTAFWNQKRNNNNGRWGLNSAYTFRGYIYLPADVQKIVDDIINPPAPTPEPTPGPSDKFNIGDKVMISGPIYTSSNASKPAGEVKDKITVITRKNPGSAHPYNTEGDLGWMDEESINAYIEPTPIPEPTPEPVPQPEPTPQPEPDKLKVGDSVKIIGTGNGSSYGTSNKAYGIGWTRQILKIWDGRPYPYQVGNNTATTGFYKAEALQKL